VGSKLVIQALVLAGAALAAGAFGAIAGAFLFPPTWRAIAQVSVDWNRMPIEASGEERGLLGATMRDLLSGEADAFRAAFAKDSGVQIALGLSEQELMRCVGASSIRRGDVLMINLEATGSDQARCLEIVQAFANHSHDVVRSYRDLEWFGQFFSMGRESDRTGDHGGFLLSLLAAGVANPIRVSRPPEIEQDWSRPLIGAVSFGGLSALVVAGTGLAALVVLRGRRRGPK
jgi:hypothetical protein